MLSRLNHDEAGRPNFVRGWHMTEYSQVYEHDQRKRTLNIIIWVVLLASLALGIYNIQFNTWPSIVALFFLALLCIPLLVLNAREYYAASAVILSLIIL